MVRRAQGEPADNQLSQRSRRMERSVYTVFFNRSDPWYKLPAATLRRLSHPVSQTGPSGPTVHVQQKSRFFAITFIETLLAKSMNQNPRKHDVVAKKSLTFSQNAAVEQIFE